MSKKKQVAFPSLKEEQEFWSKNDVLEFADLEHPIKNPVFPNLKPSNKTISLRLPLNMLVEIKKQANRQDVPYQSLIKMYLSERLRRESGAHRA